MRVRVYVWLYVYVCVWGERSRVLTQIARKFLSIFSLINRRIWIYFVERWPADYGRLMYNLHESALIYVSLFMTCVDKSQSMLIVEGAYEHKQTSW